MLVTRSAPRGAPSPLVGEGRGGGDSWTFGIGLPPTSIPSPQGGGEVLADVGGVQRHPGEGRDPVHRSAMVWVAAVLLALCSLLTPAAAVQPDEVLKDP